MCVSVCLCVSKWINQYNGYFVFMLDYNEVFQK